MNCITIDVFFTAFSHPCKRKKKQADSCINCKDSLIKSRFTLQTKGKGKLYRLYHIRSKMPSTTLLFPQKHIRAIPGKIYAFFRELVSGVIISKPDLSHHYSCENATKEEGKDAADEEKTTTSLFPESNNIDRSLNGGCSVIPCSMDVSDLNTPISIFFHFSWYTPAVKLYSPQTQCDSQRNFQWWKSIHHIERNGRTTCYGLVV